MFFPRMADKKKITFQLLAGGIENRMDSRRPIGGRNCWGCKDLPALKAHVHFSVAYVRRALSQPQTMPSMAFPATFPRLQSDTFLLPCRPSTGFFWRWHYQANRSTDNINRQDSRHLQNIAYISPSPRDDGAGSTPHTPLVCSDRCKAKPT
jgi:hypothetical protein